MQLLDGAIEMQRDEFIKMVMETNFDIEIKNLFITSFDMGYREGQIEQLTKTINAFDSSEDRIIQ